jgi:hypothetical protein
MLKCWKRECTGTPVLSSVMLRFAHELYGIPSSVDCFGHSCFPRVYTSKSCYVAYDLLQMTIALRRSK